MTYIVETLTNGEFKAIITPDSDTDSPRTWDNVGTVALHTRTARHYGFGDETLDGEYLQEIVSSPDYLHLPIYLYDHSGITIRTSRFSCTWDTLCVGIIYVKRSELPDLAQQWGHTPWTDEQVLDILKSEIDTLDQYLTGEVYRYCIEDADGNELDSCGGIYGLEDAKSEAKAALDHYAERAAVAAKSESEEAQYWACRDVVTT